MGDYKPTNQPKATVFASVGPCWAPSPLCSPDASPWHKSLVGLSNQPLGGRPLVALTLTPAPRTKPRMRAAVRFHNHKPHMVFLTLVPMTMPKYGYGYICENHRGHNMVMVTFDPTI